MLVRAKAKGFYGSLRKIGDMFALVPTEDADGNTVSPKKQFSAAWMTPVDAEGNDVGSKKATKKATKKKPEKAEEPEKTEKPKTRSRRRRGA